RDNVAKGSPLLCHCDRACMTPPGVLESKLRLIRHTEGDWIMSNVAQITFPQAHEIAGYWDWDKIHAPRPLTPLAGDAVVNTMGEGFTIAQHGFGSMLALRCRMVNNYLY